MKVQLSSAAFFQSLKESTTIRTVQESDLAALSTLFYYGYKGSIDYQGETLNTYEKEIKALIKGLYGPFLFDSSYLLIRKEKVLSASLITLFQNIPILMYAVTLPEHKCKGFFSQVLSHSMNSLYKKGYKELYLVVTNGNHSAQYIYKKFGFQEISLDWNEIVQDKK